MTDQSVRLDNDAAALRAAAERVHVDTLDPACAPGAPAALKAIDDALITLSRACYAAAHSFIPLGDIEHTISDRYARAAATWPSPRSASGPSHEQQALVLSSLHDAGAAVRAAAGHCGRAASNLAATMEPEERFGKSHAARAAPSGVTVAPDSEPCRTSRTRSVRARPFGRVA
jgi:hypothetical protein